MNVHEARQRIEALRLEARGLMTTAGDGAMDAAAESRFSTIEAETAQLRTAERRAAFVDQADRSSIGQPVPGTGDAHLDRLADGVGLLDAVRSQMGGTDAAAGRAREVSAELERRSGRKAQGLFWHMGQPAAEQRVLTTGLPVAGPGGALIPTDYRPDMFIDRLRNATRVRALGATVLAGLTGNVVIPRRKASMVAGWVAENSPLNVSDPQFDGVSLTPKHAGLITEFSRNMVMQASPDVEALARQDMALILAELLDAAAVSGTGTNNQPKGILNTAGIGAVSIGPNGGPLTYDAVADLMGQVDDANADGTSMGFLTNSKVRRAAAKLKTTYGEPLGLDVVFQGMKPAISNLIPSNGAKGTGTGLSSLLYANWSDLLIGVWSELDILVNPYESGAYSKGNVSIRAMVTLDVSVRHPESFAAITDLAA